MWLEICIDSVLIVKQFYPFYKFKNKVKGANHPYFKGCLSISRTALTYCSRLKVCMPTLFPEFGTFLPYSPMQVTDLVQRIYECVNVDRNSRNENSPPRWWRRSLSICTLDAAWKTISFGVVELPNDSSNTDTLPKTRSFEVTSVKSN